MLTLLPLFSRAPCSIHSFRTAICASAILGCCGGIFGSSVWAVSVYSRDLSGLPAMNTAPELPPSFRAANVATFSPPFCLSLPWQLTQCCLRTGSTSSLYVGFLPSARTTDPPPDSARSEPRNIN